MPPKFIFDGSVPVLSLSGTFNLLEYLIEYEELSILGDGGAFSDIFDRLQTGCIVVVERHYFDVDIRSEQKRLIDRLSSLPNFGTPRLHFFAPGTTSEHLEGVCLGEDDIDLQSTYLGYMIVRQHGGGSVGRTMLRPEALGVSRSDAVRCWAEEEVDFFGRPLTVRAVPFMQQDSLVVACFDVCLWMASYVMTLSGYLPRSTSGFVASVSQPASGIARYPNRSTATDAVDDLGRQLGFSVRSRLVATYQSQPDFELDLISHLNSGFPIVWISTEDPPTPHEIAARSEEEQKPVPYEFEAEQHSVVLCGFTRRSDGSLESLLYHDDRYGPYLEMPVPKGIPNLRTATAVPDDTEDQEALQHLAWGDERELDAFDTIALFLAPQGVWMGPHQAVTTAIQCASAMCSGIDAYIRDAAAEQNDLPADEQVELQNWLSELRHAVDPWRNLGEPHRAYAMLSVDFKRRYADLNQDAPEIYSMLWGRQLPKFVWVVEWFDLKEWKSPERSSPCVLAEALLDASSPEAEERLFWLRHGWTVTASTSGQGLTPRDRRWREGREWFIAELQELAPDGDGKPLLQRSSRRSNYSPFNSSPPLRHSYKTALRSGIS